MPFYLTINNQRLAAQEGEYVLAVARRAGIEIPTLCHHPAVEPFGACRLCLVEVTKESWKGWKGLMTACLYPAAPDLIIETDSPRVRQVRRNVLDLLLARCPQSELIRRLAAQYGVGATSFERREDPDNCILCGLCVRVCETAATSAISTVNRGRDRAVGAPWDCAPPDCLGCLACAQVCPTKHIQFQDGDGRRQIWGRDFFLARCSGCGAPLPITVEQAAFLAERQKLDASYLERCPACQRITSAQTLSSLAQLSQEQGSQEQP